MGSFFTSLITPPPEPATDSTDSRVQAFHSSSDWNNHFNSVKSSSTLVVIDFTATWCGPCKLIAPVFAEFSNAYPDVSFVKIDVDELKDVAKEFSVQAMPTFVFLKKGKTVDKVVGGKKDELKRKIEMHRG